MYGYAVKKSSKVLSNVVLSSELALSLDYLRYTKRDD